ncbi:MAG: MBL fold metallo-hydrolase [Myxococcota bacterium]
MGGSFLSERSFLHGARRDETPRPHVSSDFEGPHCYLAAMSQVWTRSRAGTASPPQVRQPVPERPTLHAIELPLDWAPGSTQAYLIEGQPLTLIDAGVASPASQAALTAALDGLGYALSDVERVVVTHAHRDHFGFVEGLRAAGADLECCVHEADADRVERYAQVLRARIRETPPLFAAFGVPAEVTERLAREREASVEAELAEGRPTRVDRRLVEGDRIGFKDWDLTVLHAPGHTPGHIVLEDETSGLVFSGDQVMAQAIPHAENFFVDGLPDPADPLRRRPRFRGLVEMRRTLRRLRRRSVRVVLPGYGMALRRGQRAVQDTLLYYDVRLQRIDRGLRSLAAMDQDVTAWELFQALFPVDEPERDLRAHMLLLIGALDCLEEDGLLVTERRGDGVFTHHRG